MSDLVLPGTIPGLLRRGSPVVVLAGRYAGAVGVVVRVRGDTADVALDLPSAADALSFALGEIALDLTDATGRAHAAWWVEAASAAIYGESYRMHPEALRAMRLAASGAEMPDAQVATLRDLCLYVAGMGQPS